MYDVRVYDIVNRKDVLQSNTNFQYPVTAEKSRAACEFNWFSWRLGDGKQKFSMRPQLNDESAFYRLLWAVEKRNSLCAHNFCRSFKFRGEDGRIA